MSPGTTSLWTADGPHGDLARGSVKPRTFGAGAPCFVIAEVGVNHNGDPRLAQALIDAAADAGADAVKFQTFSAERLLTVSAPKAEYQLRGTDPEETQFEMLRRLELPRQCYPDLVSRCRERGVLFLSTPFDEDSADFLGSLGMPYFKVPSGELTNLPLLAHIAAKGQPMLVSTGMSDLDEVSAAVDAIRAAGNPELVLLHCVSNYPARVEDANLRAMETLAREFGVPAGYSDHVPGTEVSLAAAALGACVIEKHFTLDRDMPGPDHRASSSEPAEFRALVARIRRIESALGTGEKKPAASELPIAAVARRSLVAACDIPAGAVLTEDMVAIRRPGNGLPPAMRGHLIGRRARQAIPAGTLLSGDFVE